MSIFDELQTSLQEAVDIKHGKDQAMGTSVDTIKSWESKRHNPTGLAAKVLATIQDNPAFFNELASH